MTFEESTFQKRTAVMLDLGFREQALPSLWKYLQLLWSANEELNLISRKMTVEDLIDNHVIDCMLPLRLFPAQVGKVADFGSGGGLPSVIYALQFPEVSFHLYEKSPLKQDFLKRCQKIAPNLQIHAQIGIKLDRVDLVTARAFKPIDVMLDVSRDYFQQGGSYFLLKGRREKIEEEMLLARKKFKNLEVTVSPLKSPLLDVERHLVEIQPKK